MARVAFVMDKLLRKIGLSGRSFVPYADWVWMQRSGNHGYPHPIQRAGSKNDHSADTRLCPAAPSFRSMQYLPPPSFQTMLALVMICLVCVGYTHCNFMRA